jgi:hypothetical protein
MTNMLKRVKGVNTVKIKIAMDEEEVRNSIWYSNTFDGWKDA